MAEVQSFGQWLHQRRRELDLTQEELARQIGCASITIRKIEADQIRPSKQLAGLLRESLGGSEGGIEDFIRFARGGKKFEPEFAKIPNHNLPAPVSSFIGREREIEKVQHLMAISRLVTLTGSGGTGKTRLALRVANEALGRFPDGIWFVSFAPLSEPGMVAQTIASVLRIREDQDYPIEETLIDHLSLRNSVLLLDNCEHLITECARIVEKLLQGCPRLRILVTSREALNISGEHQFSVPALSLPDEKETTSISELMHSEAMQLFVERAQAVKSDFRLTQQNAGAVVQICRRLDGIPFAIELAAARVKGLSVEQIATRLNDRFHILTDGSRTALPRQSTLQATIEWSYKLLTEEEQALFRRLSVFAGGWILDAAEFICSGDGLESNQILDLLTRLIDKSLVIAETDEGESSYRMLETTRQFSMEKLEESGEAGELQDRHLRFYLLWGEQADQGIMSRDYQLWLEKLENERNNLREALNYGLNSRQPSKAMKLLGSTYWIWFIRGPYGEGQRWAEAVLAQTPNEHSEARAKTLTALGSFYFSQANFAEACKSLSQSMNLWQKLEDNRGYTFAACLLGFCLLRQGENEATEYFEDALKNAKEIGDPWLLAFCLHLLGENENYRGHPSEARPKVEESLRIIHVLGDHMIHADVIANLGEIADHERDYPRALNMYEEGLALANKVSDLDTVANLCFDMGRVCQIVGDTERAAKLFRETLQLSIRNGKRTTLTGAIAGLGVVAHEHGDSFRAARLMGASEALLDQLHQKVYTDPMDRTWLEQNLNLVRTALGEENFSSFWKEGQAMILDQAIQYALEEI